VTTRAGLRTCLIGCSVLAVAAVLLIGASAQAGASTFGKTTVGATTVYASPDYKFVSSFTLPVDADVSKLTVNVKGSGTSGAQPMRGVIYADSAGVPASLKATSTEVTVAFNAAKGWVDLPFGSSVRLTAGTYWLGIHSGPGTGDALIYYSYDTVTSGLDQRNDPYSDGASSPFGTPTVKDRQMSVYATYTQAPPTNTSPPTISGTAQDGQVLSAEKGTWTGSPTFTYQWRSCNASGGACTDISGATASAYTVGSADVGSTLRVVVTGTNAGGSTSASSAQSAVASGVAPANQSPPAITGTAQQGQTLTASPGTWTGSTPLTYGYQWARCNSGGANCVPVSSTTPTTYTLSSLDVGATIRVVVTASNSAGSSSSTSAATSVVVAAAQAPVNTGLPTISGTAQEGQTLSASTGTWTGTPPITYAYQWTRCDSAGANCTNIGSATASTYTLVQEDVGARIRVVVTASNSAGPSSATSAATAVVLDSGGPASPPVNTAPPTISGTAQDGQTIHASTGSWTGTPAPTYAFQWDRCDSAGANCIDISDATAADYAVGTADVGSTLMVVVTATNSEGTAVATSTPSGVVAPAPTPPTNTDPPTISGTAEDGQTLTASTGDWDGTTPISYGYQWRRCNTSGANCADITGATASTYVAIPADVGSTLRAAVTASNVAGSATTASPQTDVVVAAPPAEVSSPTISGTAREGQTLTASPGSWTGTPPISYTYQWQRCDIADNSCVDLDGATDQTYALTSADIGTALRVEVEATNDAGSTIAGSALTAIVTALAGPPNNTSLPTIGGIVQDGRTLTATNGAWTGSTPMTFSYQWQRCHAAGDSCVPIAGGMNQTYGLTSADVGSTIRVQVTANNAGGSAQATSAATAVVAATPPSIAVPPTISGVAQQNQALRASIGTWAGTTPISYAYQWRRCNANGNSCADIGGATANIYTLVAADVGSTIRVMVTASNPAGSNSATSAQTAAVTPSGAGSSTFGKTAVGATTTYASADWKFVSKFTLTENASVQKLTANVLGSGLSGAQPIRGVIYADSAGNPGALKAVSQEVTIAFNAPRSWVDLPLSTPVSLSPGSYWLGLHAGAPASGNALTYFAYDTVTAAGRQRNDAYSDGASDPFGTPTPKDRELSVYATYSSTSPTPPTNTAPPGISGQAAVGSTLSAGTGTWSGSSPISFAYQWRRCDTSGANCVDIVPSASSTYTLTSADFGSTIRVVVTASNPGGTSSATSAATDAVQAAPQTDPVVMAAGDIACGDDSIGGGCAQMATSDLLVAQSPTAVLTLGDDQYECGELNNFQDFYGPSWGRVRPKTYPVPGNHEYEVSDDPSDPCLALPTGAPGYFGYFGAAATPRDPSCTDHCSGWYSFDLGGWHLIAINSNCDEIGGCETGSPEETWLRADLAQTNKACVLAYWHHPRFTSGGHATDPTTKAMSDMWNDLYNAHADLVMSGHDHDYERFARLGASDPTSFDPTLDAQNGLREFIVGTGGRSHGTFPSTIRTGSEVRNNTTYGVLKLTLHPTSYDWQFVPAGGGTFTDSGSTACH
jgi:Calcineurin-like phosphoesterase